MARTIKPTPKAPAKKIERTTQGLRDILFNEIEELQTDAADPRKAMAVANLARQIVNTAKVELEFVRGLQAAKESGGSAELGSLRLGSA
jgi:hypothetical protein